MRKPDPTTIALDDLTTDPNNARLHNERNLATITTSLQEVGAARSIVIDDEGVILAGNATAQAAQKAGLTRVQVVDADGDTLIAVRRRGLSPEQKTRLALFDNRANDQSSFDPLMLAGLQAEGVSLEGLWTGDELDALLSDLPSLEEVHSVAEPERGSRAETDRQEREVSPRPPSADTEPLTPVPGLDRVTPDQETSRAGIFIHFRTLKIPLSAEEAAALDVRLAAYREETGTFYGFIGKMLGEAGDAPGA